MDSISFQSTIRPVSPQHFKDVVSTYGKKKFIAYPWTVKESVISDKLYTSGVEDCSFFAITNGIKALGMHLCPTMEANFNFSKIKEFIESKFNLKDPNLQGLILGGRRHSEENGSYRLFDNLENIFKTNKIPYSKFKGGGLPIDVAYDSVKDEFLISTLFAQSETVRNRDQPDFILDQIFDEVMISKEDEVSW